jgi:hypothetical protein
MTVVDPAVVNRMASIVPGHSAETIQSQFGISLNTWSKLRKGLAIRRSVAERLLERLERQTFQ